MLTSRLPNREKRRVSYHKWMKLQKSKLLPIHYSMQRIKDQKLVKAIMMFVTWRIGDWRYYDFETHFELYSCIDEYFNIIIDICKKCLGLKCKHMVELIEIYEYYYWCAYVKKRVTTKEWMDRLNMTWEKSTRFKLELRGQDWSNWDQMYLGVLLETIGDEYEDGINELMNGLDVVLDFVRAKYEMMAAQIQHVPTKNS